MNCIYLFTVYFSSKCLEGSVYWERFQFWKFIEIVHAFAPARSPKKLSLYILSFSCINCCGRSFLLNKLNAWNIIIFYSLHCSEFSTKDNICLNIEEHIIAFHFQFTSIKKSSVHVIFQEHNNSFISCILTDKFCALPHCYL